MRNFDHDNLNRFIGVAVESAQSISVWRYCSRGPLCDVIVGANMLTMDAFFIYSLVKDICEVRLGSETDFEKHRGDHKIQGSLVITTLKKIQHSKS